jgi:polar amino acid transport system substrate-binding protein
MKKLFKTLPVLMAAGAMLVGCNQGGSTSEVGKIMNAGVINIGITDYEPMDFKNEKGEWVGFDADLAKAFADELGVKCNFVEIDWDSKILELNSGYIDMIWNGMTITDELQQNIGLSTAYATNYQCVVVKTENVGQYTSVSSLDNKSIAVENGSAGNQAVETFSGVNAVSNQVTALMEVKAGTSDCCVIDVTMANSKVGAGDFTGLSIIPSNVISFAKEDFGIGMRKDSYLIPMVNYFLQKQYDAGTMTQLGLEYGVAVNDVAFN